MRAPKGQGLFCHYLFGAVSQLSEVLSPGLQSSFLPQIKLNSQLLGSVSFLSRRQQK